MSEELFNAMNKARIQQSLPVEYLQAIMKRCESKTPETDALVKPFQGTQAYNDIVDHARKLESERDALQNRVTTLQRLLDQRWEMMRELEVVCETKDAANAVEYVKGLKDRVKRFEEALKAYQEAYTPDGHVAPHDCFSTGPKTGHGFQDHVWCPGCYAESLAKQAKESKP